MNCCLVHFINIKPNATKHKAVWKNPHSFMFSHVTAPYAPGFFGRDTLELVKRAKYKKCCAGARLFKDYSYKMLLGLLSVVNAYQSGCIPARIYTVLNA